MNRRAVLAACVAAALPPLFGVARGAAPARVGYLSLAVSEADRSWVLAFKDQMRKLGYVEGKNFIWNERHAQGHANRLGRLADELLGLRPDVLVVYGAWHVADKLRSAAAPIVVTVVPDPVAQGLVTSLARPGGNITGFSDVHAELVPKRLELIKDVAPMTTRVAVLYYASTMTLMQVEAAEAAAAAQRLKLVPIAVQGPQPEEIERAFAALVKERAGAILVIADATVFANRRLIAELAIKNRLIVVSTVREWAEAGFTMSYGTSFHDLWRRSAVYVDKILKGAKPGDLPIEQPTKFDLVVNLKTAKAIGVTVPRSLLLRADEVIE